jgi:hypothetical protein
MDDSEREAIAPTYLAQVTADIEACVSTMGCQPILFVGSGLSKRYFAAPGWDDLLTALAKQCPLIDKDYAYYKQTLKTPLSVGEEFVHLYQQWAWDKGRNQFPADMFVENVSEQAYIKYKIAQYLTTLTPTALSTVTVNTMRAEITALQDVKPHAVITTKLRPIPRTGLS